MKTKTFLSLSLTFLASLVIIAFYGCKISSPSVEIITNNTGLPNYVILSSSLSNKTILITKAKVPTTPQYFYLSKETGTSLNAPKLVKIYGGKAYVVVTNSSGANVTPLSLPSLSSFTPINLSFEPVAIGLTRSYLLLSENNNCHIYNSASASEVATIADTSLSTTYDIDGYEFGNMLYIVSVGKDGTGTGKVVLHTYTNISTDPSSINSLTYTSSEIPKQVLIKNGYAYVVVETNEIDIYNITSGSLQLISVIDEKAQKAYIADNYLFTASGTNYITIWDISSVSLPEKIFTLNFPANKSAVSISADNVDTGKYIVAVGFSDGEVRVYEWDRFGRAIKYVAGSSYDVTPELFVYQSYIVVKVGIYIKVLEYTPSSDFYVLSLIDSGFLTEKLYKYDRYIASANGDQGFSIYEIQSTNLSPLSTISIPGYSVDVFKSSNYIFVCSSSNGISIFDISNPYSPVYKTGTNIVAYNCYTDKFGYLYIAGKEAGFYVASVSYGANTINVITNIKESANTISVYSRGKYVLTITSDGKLNVYEIKDYTSTMTNIQSVKTIQPFGGTVAISSMIIDVYRNLIFVISPGNGISVVNISNITDPQVVSVLSSTELLRNGKIYDKLLVVTSANQVLFYDTSDPSSIRAIGGITLPSASLYTEILDAIY